MFNTINIILYIFFLRITTLPYSYYNVSILTTQYTMQKDKYILLFVYTYIFSKCIQIIDFISAMVYIYMYINNNNSSMQHANIGYELFDLNETYIY